MFDFSTLTKRIQLGHFLKNKYLYIFPDYCWELS